MSFAQNQAKAQQIVLSVESLAVQFSTEDSEHLGQDKILKVLDGVSFSLKRGKTLGIVGESGCGKSVTAMSIMGLLPRPYGEVTQGKIHYFPSTHKQENLALLENASIELTSLQLKDLHALRGNRISMIFQDPMTALNPVQTIGKQLEEVYKLHRKDLNIQQRRQDALAMLEKVKIPSPELRLNEYPHQLSGGMRQRVVIAIALAAKPDILICDEPTTALDVTVQAQILDLMQALQQETGMSIIFITHDLGVIAELCDDVVVMYAGQVVESCDVFELFDHPKHPYTQGLISAIPSNTTKAKTKLKTIEGSVPALDEMPKACRFANRCIYVKDKCHQVRPELRQANAKHLVSCHFFDKLTPLKLVK